MDPSPEKPTVMLVDDTPANQQILEEMLHRHGFRVVQFLRGPPALRAAALRPPDLILLDIMMPEMDGFEVCRRLKTDPALQEIPVIFISALDDTATKVKGFAAGAADYVSKPFQEDEILARVGTHLRAASLQRQLRAHNERLEELVATRTRDLARAQDRLLELDHLKNDFLHMIAHELRTPAHGILGIGELLLDASPTSQEARLYQDLFRESGRRLSNLIDDATLIADLASVAARAEESLPLAALLDELRETHPSLRYHFQPPADPHHLSVRADPTLLRKALEAVLALASCFLQNPHSLTATGRAEDHHYCLRLTLDNLLLTAEQTAAFFQLESTVRSHSPAETLGLGPVVAHKILTAFKGDLRLVPAEGTTGFLEVRLPAVPE